MQGRREVAPQPDRAEPLVQEHERAARARSPGRSATSTVSPSTVAMAGASRPPLCALRRGVRRANMPPVIGDVLWTPPADVRETTEIGRYLNWLRDERGRDLADYDALWRWSVEDLEGFWGVDLGLLRRARARALRARPRLARDARRRVVPGRAAELRRAPAGDRRGRRRGGRRRALADARADRADLRRAARAGRAGARGPAAPGGRPRRRRRRLPAQHPRDARRLHRHRQPRGDVGGVRARVRRAQRAGALRADRAQGPARGRRLHLSRPAGRPPRAGGRDPRRACPRLEHVVHVPYGENELPDAVSWERPPAPNPPRSRSSPSPSTTRSTCSSRRAPPGCRRRSSTATAASSSSTSRASAWAGTSSPAGGCCGSRPPRG